MGISAYLPVDLAVGVQNLLGIGEIPSDLIFRPIAVPLAFGLTSELLRSWIFKGMQKVVVSKLYGSDNK